MPKIVHLDQTASAKIVVNKRILDAYQAALARANKAGIRVEVQTDFEQTMKRITKIVNDSIGEAHPVPAGDHHQGENQA